MCITVGSVRPIRTKIKFAQRPLLWTSVPNFIHVRCGLDDVKLANGRISRLCVHFLYIMQR
jgi:hypothetical protein